MEFTGERLIPESSDPDLLSEHLARYCFAESFVLGKRVLDAGCGAGYGAARLVDSANQVLALDNAAEAVNHCKTSYPSVLFIQADCTEMPVEDASLDVVIAFEVIEHLKDWQKLVSEAARVLTPSGVLLVSTPNRDYYASTRTTPNPFHIHEFNYEEFCGALMQVFPHSRVFLENHSPAVAFTADHSRQPLAKFETEASDPSTAHFFVGLCSMSPLSWQPSMVYIPAQGNVLRERELHIQKLKEWIDTLEHKHAEVQGMLGRELRRVPYRILRRLHLAPQLPEKLRQENRED